MTFHSEFFQLYHSTVESDWSESVESFSTTAALTVVPAARQITYSDELLLVLVFRHVL